MKRFSHRLFCSTIEDVNKDVILYSLKRQTPVSLKALMDTGKGNKLSMFGFGKETSTATSERIIQQVACFLHREIPVRIAHRIVQIQSFPLYSRSSSMQNVCSWYKSAFSKIKSSPIPDTPEKEAEYANLLHEIYDKHSSIMLTMAKALYDARKLFEREGDRFCDERDIQKFFDEFYIARIGSRMLTAQYLELRKPHHDENMIGLISLKTSPYDVAQDAIRDASYICTRVHGDSPAVNILGRTDLTFPYVPSHLSYMLLELLKNSMRATVEKHGIDDMPSIKIIIADGEDNEDVVIKVSDEGGGIRRSNMNHIWSYLYTTADPSTLRELFESDDSTRDFSASSPLAGLGYGLPIARNYARYFGGDLKLMSMEGYGTDGYVYLPRLSNTDLSVV